MTINELLLFSGAVAVLIVWMGLVVYVPLRIFAWAVRRYGERGGLAAAGFNIWLVISSALLLYYVADLVGAT